MLDSTLNMNLRNKYNEAADILKKSRFTTAFTGAGISVESGIPPFRGEGGLWSKYDPGILEISYFMDHPTESWIVIKEIFYDYFGQAKPNKAHMVLSRMESEGLLGSTITQNIDNLHQESGSRLVYEFHGNSKKLICLTCQRIYRFNEISLDHIPPTCRECGGLLKPNFIFFGETIPKSPLAAAYDAASISDVFLIIGTSGEIMPANQFPFLAKNNGAKIVEINLKPSNYTQRITDVFIQGKAAESMYEMEKILFPTALNDNEDRIN